jgi:hypothetical protein
MASRRLPLASRLPARLLLGEDRLVRLRQAVVDDVERVRRVRGHQRTGEDGAEPGGQRRMRCTGSQTDDQQAAGEPGEAGADPDIGQNTEHVLAMALNELLRTPHRRSRGKPFEHDDGGRDRPANCEQDPGDDQQQQPEPDADAHQDRRRQQRAEPGAGAAVEVGQGARRLAAMLVVHDLDERALNEGRADEADERGQERRSLEDAERCEHDESGQERAQEERPVQKPRVLEDAFDLERLRAHRRVDRRPDCAAHPSHGCCPLGTLSRYAAQSP